MIAHRILMFIVAVLFVVLFIDRLEKHIIDPILKKTSKELDKTGGINKAPAKEASGTVNFDNVNAKEIVAKAVKYLPVSDLHSVSKMPEVDIASYLNKKIGEHKSLNRYQTQVNKLSRELAVAIKTNELV